ncbi:MAG TPA: glycoside hydrolase family 2 TIM barrel-domain containing protein [Candidatus Hydrogenedentes bacterium]|nr:glycoside hydrolase family 2 TIM barrel-domain containing protein [Candidatus Hydrogenedentota bacterium]
MSSVRSHLSLDGEWRLALDPGDTGLREQWFAQTARQESIPVRVPSVWDLWVPDYDGVGWYFREFSIDPAWSSQHVELHFEAADYYAEVWLNGIRLGEHEGGYTPFSFVVTPHLRESANLLSVRIIDPHGENGYGDFHPKEFPASKEGGYFSFAGLWGSVWLEAKPKVYIEDIFVQPDIRRKRITVEVTAPACGMVHLQIEGTPYHLQGAPGTLTLDFPDFELWAPETPKLYTLRADLIQEDGTFDSVSVRFGMREFTVKDNRFCLNNRPLFIKAVLHQPDYPRSLVAPESLELARKEILLAKEAGFNMLRLHIKTAPRITLDLADEIGMLLYEEPPIGWIKRSEFMKTRCENEVREMILRDRNHPSVVIWGMLNESGNAGYVSKGGAQIIKDDLCKLARSLDPSRLIIDDSGGVNATREPARMIRSYREEFEEYDDLHIYQRAPVDHDIERYYRYNGDPDKMVFLSEFGFGGPEDMESTLAQYGAGAASLKDARFVAKMLEASQRGFHERDLDRVFGSFSGFLAAARELQSDAARFHIDAIRSNSKIAGYCYTQLCDAGHEFCAGILDRWRRPKPVFEAMKQVQRSIRPLIQIAESNLVPRQEIPVTILLANEDRLEGRADLSLQVIGPTNQVLWKKKRAVKIPKHGKELWSGSIAASGSAGMHKLVVRLMQGMKILGENTLEFYVCDPAKKAETAICLLDPNNEWHDRCAPFATLESLMAPVYVIPPLGNTIRAYPESDLMQILAQAEGGAVALFFEPPDDWNDLAQRLADSLKATPKDAVGCFLMACHYAKLHPIFSGLPARGIMRQPYRNVIPSKTFLEVGDEDISGTFDTIPIASGNYMMGETKWWGSDILVLRYGSGCIVFTHLRVMEHLGKDPVADRLFVNLLNHFSRQSVPSDTALPMDQKAVEWLRNERLQRTRRWMVIGEFPNWSGQGHATAYPPEEAIDFSATYPGWYKAISWKPWYSKADDKHTLDLQAAFSPVFEYYPRFDHASAYAYAEFTCDKRQEVKLNIGVQNAMKIWLNSALIHESNYQVPHDQFGEETASGFFRQGRNTLLVKCSKIPGPFRFSLDFESLTKEPLQLTWWR